MLAPQQKQAAQAIVNVFETGSATGDYANVTLIAGDAGHLTYGRAQTTLASGNLFLLVRAYVAAPDAALAGPLAAYLPRLEAEDATLDEDAALHGLLHRAGSDPVMRAVQDRFFDSLYWAPALNRCAATGIGSALGAAIVYDSTVHGNWPAIRDATIARAGRIGAGVTEAAWLHAYLETRRQWLAGNANPVLHGCCYRMDALLALLAAGNWALDLPLVVHGVRIDAAALAGPQVQRSSAETTPLRLLSLKDPPLRGVDVTALQSALAEHGGMLEVTGTFDRGTQAALLAFQLRAQLTADGIAGPATRNALDLG